MRRAVRKMQYRRAPAIERWQRRSFDVERALAVHQPCTVHQLVALTGLPRYAVQVLVALAVADGRAERVPGSWRYRAVQPGATPGRRVRP